MPASPYIAQVALPVPLRRTFDYLAAPETDLSPGMRVRVAFGRKLKQVGLVINVTDKTALDRKKLKYIDKRLDSEALVSRAHLHFLQWSSDYYQHPLGEVVFGALPALLRQGRPARTKTGFRWQLSGEAKALATDALKRAPNQRRIIELLQAHPQGVTDEELRSLPFNFAAPLKALQQKSMIKKTALDNRARPTPPARAIRLNTEQAAAVDAIEKNLHGYQCVLLDGVTGSGKTEVYIDLIRQVVESGQQALVLVPEIGLTPQFISRLQQQLGTAPVLLHSALSESERLKNWLLARAGKAAIVLGTRSAIWTPLQRPGLIIVDEEHDLSYKQQDGFRYSARDLAVLRAKLADIPVVLGSATPSMESLHNVNAGKSLHLRLGKRIGALRPPPLKLINLRAQAMSGALSRELIQAIDAALRHEKQILLFLNRRGFSPIMLCHQCGWVAHCERCEIPLTYHKHKNKMLCHHCASRRPVLRACPECGQDGLLLVGHGTERLTESLAAIFPGARILRIDRDSTRRRGSMQALVDTITAGAADILVGTQMLAKGHHFPKLTLVGIIDTDQGLFSADFRASERMAQLFIQVSGRAGRTTTPGTVLVQTHYPEHPLLQTLIHHGYAKFARALLKERKGAGLPPFSYLALLRAETKRVEMIESFFADAIRILDKNRHGLARYGPIPAPMAKRSGRLRYQLLLQSKERSRFKRHLGDWCRQLEALPSAKRVRWSLDVDPQDML